MLSPQSRKILALNHWLKPQTVSTMLAKWVHDLLPTDELRKRRIIKAAALAGTQLGDDVLIGQVSYIQHKAKIVAFGIRTPAAASAFHEFGRECAMVSRASILRTCIMMGLRLPRIEKGVMSQTRKEKLSDQEIFALVEQARERFPEEMIE